MRECWIREGSYLPVLAKTKSSRKQWIYSIKNFEILMQDVFN